MKQYLELVKALKDYPHIQVIGNKKLTSLANSYFYHFSEEFHKEKGANFSEDGMTTFSIAPFKVAKLKEYRERNKIKETADSHIFENDYLTGKPDIHRIFPESPANIPLFLDQKEINYYNANVEFLRKKHYGLKRKYTEKKD